MGIEVLTRAAKRSYEKYFAQEQNGIDKALFSIPDEDTTAAFMLDRFVESPFGVVYREKGNESHSRIYQPGTGYIYDVPRASEKTPIDEELRDAAIKGLESFSGSAAHLEKLMRDIVKQHVSGHNMTKWKQALDVIFDGEFYAVGDGGADIGLGIDYSRAGANELTHDFTDTDTIPIAFKEMQDQLLAQGSPINNMVVILGSTYLNEFTTDTSVLSYLDSNTANQLLMQDMMPMQLRNAHGLHVVATYRAPSMVAPVYVCSFQPGSPYYEYKGASASAWVSATKAAMFSLDTPMYRVLRGVDAFDESGRVQRAIGDIVLDAFAENDPIVEVMRSQSRHCFVPGNINHTVVSTGTFS